MRTLNQIAARLEAGEPSQALIGQCLDRIKDASGEGGRTFLKVHGEAARTTARFTVSPMSYSLRSTNTRWPWDFSSRTKSIPAAVNISRPTL